MASSAALTEGAAAAAAPLAPEAAAAAIVRLSFCLLSCCGVMSNSCVRLSSSSRDDRCMAAYVANFASSACRLLSEVSAGLTSADAFAALP